jgi:transglutaminase/protease-like cytokinesis protein 3
MKRLLLIIFILITYTVFAQPKSVSLTNFEEASPAALAQLVTANDTTAIQKVKSIFRWVTDNIAYNVKSFQNRTRISANDYWLEEDDDTSAVLKPLNERVAERVLKRRTAVCDGYARLFKILCDNAGIPCEIVTGYGRTNINRIGARFISNHKWNAVLIDSGWYLLDATWASGYINYRDEFEKEFNGRYFLASPEEFINDHYPEDPRWTLLSSPPTLKEFYNTPFKTSAFNRNYVSSFSPQNGIIEAAVDDSITIEIETRYPHRNLWATDIVTADSNAIAVLQCCGVNKPANIIKGNKVSYTYHITSADAQWLNVIYDDELIMRYKLYIKKDSIQNLLNATPTLQVRNDVQ